jgi:hypothetical protein
MMESFVRISGFAGGLAGFAAAGFEAAGFEAAGLAGFGGCCAHSVAETINNAPYILQLVI